MPSLTSKFGELKNATQKFVKRAVACISSHSVIIQNLVFLRTHCLRLIKVRGSLPISVDRAASGRIGLHCTALDCTRIAPTNSRRAPRGATRDSSRLAWGTPRHQSQSIKGEEMTNNAEIPHEDIEESKPPESAEPATPAKDMDRWLGDGGMEIIGLVGAGFDAYGIDGEDLGWAAAAWTPTKLACNPHGTAQAGVHSLLLDAAMNFAINAALRGRDRTRGTLEMKTETMRPAALGATFRVRGEVVRMARQVAFAEATVRDTSGALVSRSTGTFLLHRHQEA